MVLCRIDLQAIYISYHLNFLLFLLVGLLDSDDEKIIYKIIVSIGMICQECTVLQFAVSDEGCLELILGTQACICFRKNTYHNMPCKI
jgi:hypothetical protein